MKTGDLYINRHKRVSIHIQGNESAFISESFDKQHRHASLDRGSTQHYNLMFNCTIGEDEIKPININILDFLNDPDVLKLLRKKADE